MANNNKLVSCLAELTHILGRPTSEATLLSGLPTVDGVLTKELFERAAQHVNLQTKFIKFKLKKSTYHFPIPPILLLKNDDACLLETITDHNTIKIINSAHVEEEVPFDEFAKNYSGEAFFVEPDVHFHTSADYMPDDVQDKSWFWNSIRRLWSSYSEMLIASLLINLFALAVPLFTMNVYDRVVPNKIFDTLWVLASGILIVFIFDSIMRVLRGYFIDQAGKVVDAQVSANIFEKTLGIRLVDRPRSVGVFANTVQSFESIREFITSTTITVLVDLPFALLFIAIIALIGGPLALVPLILLPLSALFSYFLQRPLVTLTKNAHRYSAEKDALLFETLNGIETVKSSCAERVMQNKWEQVINLSAQTGIRLRFLSNLGIFFSIFMQQLATVLVVIAGVYLISSNDLTIGGLIACTILTSRALAPMSQIAALFTRYHQSTNALDNLNQIMTLPLERPVGHPALNVPHLKGEIELRDVSFHFKEHQMPVLQKISIKIKPGEHIGIIGRIGSGKTTLAKLLIGLLQPAEGSIFFDAIDQSHFELTELRKQLGYVPQEITLFHGTLYDNITLGVPNVDDSSILTAIDVSGVDEFVKPKLGSYEAYISEGGKNISGGQKQIVAIARALLLNPPIIVCDEPTNSMDNQTEAVVKAKLEPFIKNKTFILMTHHPSMLTLVDRLIILDAGRLIIDGPKDEVLKALSEGKIQIPKV